jgi:hypothetical protein
MFLPLFSIWYVQIVFDVTDLIIRQDSHDIDRMLGLLYTRLQGDVGLCNMVRFDVKPKRLQNDDLVTRINLYQGPDRETQDLLEANFARWSLQPESFWKSSGDDMYLNLDAQAQIVRSYVRAQGGDA